MDRTRLAGFRAVGFTEDRLATEVDPESRALVEPHQRRGLSVVIAPEATHSATKKPGKFKKGAFHMAMAAGVPIPTTGWRREDLDAPIAGIETLYHQTLTSERRSAARGPGSGAWRERTCRSQ